MARKKQQQPQPKPIPREALRWTEPVRPDVPPPAGGGGLSKGFLPNAYSMRVEPACSSVVSHAFGRDDDTTSQGSRHIFSTRLRALQAMRHEVELEAARKLAEIDALIEAENGSSAAAQPRSEKE